ncbi:UPF0755 protein [Propionibacterium cyclohexanicum]|uniref:Endolytic murein transglycosylase n=1 Tax=Propionibacterium cyclohexanicum TaxID=64702 RepID=A0A1H9Q329_9ACTN|nr:endolytic transglycosylase MltG [Propionibacterium cyclohexanicum]SER54505.1 UPF0755 protein [Propionibacterium cyclohexanicum]
MTPKRAAEEPDDLLARRGSGQRESADELSRSPHSSAADPAPRQGAGHEWLGARQEADDPDSLLASVPYRESGARRPWLWLRTAIVVLVSLAVLVGGGLFAYHKVSEAWRAYQGADYSGTGTTEVTVDIDSGQSVAQMGDLLVSRDVVASSRAFMRAAKAEPRTNAIQPGTYRMKAHMSAKSAVAALVNPANIISHSVTLPEGLRNSEVFERASAATGIPVDQFRAAAANPAALGLPSWAKGNSEGLLFPQTYPYDDRTTATSLLSAMVTQFNQVSASEGLESGAAAIGRSPLDVLIVASIIERETVNPDYGPQMAEVFYNRLNRGMKLQSDATVHYANNTSGNVTTTDAERAIDSPYNTYRITGLPPGPISNPGRRAIDSALHPATGDLLYFVTVNPDTGETKFASNDSDHEKNVAQFQSWCRANSGRCG